jgi:hypothetical protein
MAEADWTTLTNGLTSANVRSGVSMAPDFEPPNGSFVYFYNVVGSTAGVAARRVSLTNFNPTAYGKGGSLWACMRRWGSGLTGIYPFIAFLDGLDVATAQGYILGLTNETSSRLMLKKGAISGNLLSSDSGLLRISDGSYGASWHEPRLDLIVNPQGDVVLNVYNSDLETYEPGSEVWTVPSGMEMYVDDSGGILSGSPPLLGTSPNGYYLVYGMYSEGSLARACLFDYMKVRRQLTP